MKQLIIIIVLSLLILGCPPPKKTSVDPGGMKPTHLSGLTSSRAIELTWRSAERGTFNGYNIYLAENSLKATYPNGMYAPSVKPINSLVFPGDTEVDDEVEHYPIGNLANGVKHYLSVRTVLRDGSMSPASEEIILVPGPRGEIELMGRFSGDQDGFSFGADKFARADGSDNDLIFYTKGKIAYLASPTRLDGFLNQSLLAHVPSDDDFEQVRQIVNQGDLELTDDRVEIKKNDWILIRLASAEHVLVQVRSLKTGEKPLVKLSYVTCLLPGEILF